MKNEINRAPAAKKELKGTKTEKNLMEAFAGESMARNKYTYFASKAKKDGFVQISKIFEETAANEKEHAELWYKYLNGGQISDTATNLAEAAAGENAEWTDMYARMAKEAEEEGFTEIAACRQVCYGWGNRETPRGALPQAAEEYRGQGGLLP